MLLKSLNLLALLGITSLAQVVLGDHVINNHCKQDVTIMTSQRGGCDQGPRGCLHGGNSPWKLKANKKNKTVWRHPWQGEVVSVKIGEKGKDGILQYEYAHKSEGPWWNLSDLDGEGPGLVGTHFKSDRVGVTPSGEGSSQGNCVKIRCEPDEVCLDSYQKPDDPNTRYCPADTDDMKVNLRMPKKDFSRNFP